MHDDDPDDVVHNLFAEQAYGARAPLGRPIAGTVESIEAMTRAQVAAVLPAPLPPGQHGGRRRRQPRPRRGGPAWCARALRPARLAARRRAAGAAAARGPPGPRAPGRGRGDPPVRAGQPGPRHGGRDTATTTAASRSACSTPPSVGARRPGCSRRSASAAAWPTRSSPSPATTPTPAWSASRWAACPTSSTTCWPWSAPSCPGWPRTASPRRSWCAARASCAGGLVLGLEDSGSRMSRIGKAELVHDELLGIDEVMDRIESVTLDEVRDVAAELFGSPRSWRSSARPSAGAICHDAGAGGGPEHAGEGADDEPLGGPVRALVVRRSGKRPTPLSAEHDRDALGEAGREPGEDRQPLERADPGAAAQHLAGAAGPVERLVVGRGGRPARSCPRTRRPGGDRSATDHRQQPGDGDQDGRAPPVRPRSTRPPPPRPRPRPAAAARPAARSRRPAAGPAEGAARPARTRAAPGRAAWCSRRS